MNKMVPGAAGRGKVLSAAEKKAIKKRRSWKS